MGSKRRERQARRLFRRKGSVRIQKSSSLASKIICKEVRRIIDLYCGNGNGEVEGSRFLKHLDHCRPCWSYHRGKYSESKLAQSLCALKNPPMWFLGVRAGTLKEDMQGVDLWVQTKDVGEIPIQVKSSHTAALRYWERRGSNGTVVIVVPHDISHEELGERAIGLVKSWRKEALGI